MKKIIILTLVFFTITSANAVSTSLGIFGGYDDRNLADDNNIYGFTAEFLWGKGRIRYGFGALKALQNINGVFGGYETISLNLRFGGAYIAPFYGQRAIKTSEFFKSNNLYTTKGLSVGYDLFLNKIFSIGVMGIFEDPEELDGSNANYRKLSSTFSPTLTLKMWWW